MSRLVVSACLLVSSCTLDRSGVARIRADGEVPTRDAGDGRRDSGPCAPRTCAEAGAECGSISDGCGGTRECEMCGPDLVCGAMGMPNRCGVGPCTPTTCIIQGKDCGQIPNGCDGTLDCGTCALPATCGGGGTDNVCGCTPVTCEALGAVCGNPSNGCGDVLDCGTCTSPETCTASFTCECPRTTCEVLGAGCGSPDDGCGTPLSCGTCSASTECAADFTCGPCTPDSGEPNDAPPGTPLGNVEDSPDVSDSFDVYTLHAPMQFDFYRFTATDVSGDGDSSSRIRIVLRGVDSGQDAELRVTLACPGATGSMACHEGDDISSGCQSIRPPGMDEAIELTASCPGGTVIVTIRVWLAGDAFTSCAPYTLDRIVR